MTVRSYVTHAKRFVTRTTLPTGEPYDFSLYDTTAINVDDLQREIAEHPARYAFFAHLHVLAKEAVIDATEELAAFIATIDEEVRLELSVTTRKLTETQVKMAIQNREEYRTLKGHLIEAEKAERRLGVVREALTARGHMLTAASMFRAPESGPSIDTRAKHRYRLRS